MSGRNLQEDTKEEPELINSPQAEDEGEEPLFSSPDTLSSIEEAYGEAVDLLARLGTNSEDNSSNLTPSETSSINMPTQVKINNLDIAIASAPQNASDTQTRLITKAERQTQATKDRQGL